MEIEKVLKKLGKTCHQFYVPCHTRPTDDITELVKSNRETINVTFKGILEILDTPKTTSETISSLCGQYQLDLNVVQQCYLIRMTIMAYLSYLTENEKIRPQLEKNGLRWAKQ